MSIAPGKLTDPAVAALVAAVNAHDKAAFLALLTPGATMSDDGTDRDLQEWIEREIFSCGGHMEVQKESDDGRALVVDFRNDTWGEMRTAWRFDVTADGRISRFETGQA
ncbi:nuclear transport factor 2 family protein [Streptomyces sp. NPDC091268]|uniref:nuclear transport factor 2 family protein n=1 Tax=Streptomyces sp. NPDC091268 TaxID=3365979 RepID=UPI00381F1384